MGVSIIEKEIIRMMDAYVPPYQETPKKKQHALGITLLFLLLVIPVGIYMVTQRGSVADTRSQAATLYKAATVKAPAPTSPVTSSARCNKACTKDSDCSSSGDMVCANINGTGQCRAANCPETVDCWCNKTVACNTTCTESSQCGIGKICAKIDGVGKCRSSECYAVEDCMCYVIGGSPTPSPTPAVRCNSSCSLDSDCGSSMICVVTADGNKCRNPQCYGVDTCLCYSLLSPTATPKPTSRPVTYTTVRPTATKAPTMTPTPTIASMLLADVLPTPTPLPLTPLLSVNTFYDAKQETTTNPMISGITDPNGEITVSISPDGVNAIVAAEATGEWTYTPTGLTSGKKQLLVTATSPTGGKNTKSVAFTVKSGFAVPNGIYILIGVIVILGVGVFLVIKKKGTDSGDQAVYTNPPESHS